MRRFRCELASSISGCLAVCIVPACHPLPQHQTQSCECPAGSLLLGSDIATMSVLKDASAAAIYGSRAAGGVLVITTRLGQKGKTNVIADYYTAFYKAANLPKMLNADQYLTVKDRAWHNTIGNDPNATSPYAADRNNPACAPIPNC
ncbi:MAG: hypothetical protein EON56_02460 [Alphaproteobacteria bacterium]|nr:MAG: hypothetical protein EON56_02460 [Alphaproteobacteria bacterium]